MELINSIIDQKYKKSAQKNINEYKYALNEYKVLLEKTKFLAYELHLKNSLEFSNLFTYLLWNGYFSKNRHLEYNKNNKYLIDGLESFNIMDGKGVCLNFSSMLKDFLNISSFESAMLINNFNKDSKFEYIPKIKRRIAKEKINTNLFYKLTTPISNLTGNHVFNLILENDKFYIYDATSLSIFKLKNVNEAKIINGKGNFKLKPKRSYYLNCFDDDDKILDKLFQTNDFTSPYNKDDYIYTWGKCIELFEENKYLLDDYYTSAKQNIDEIQKQVLLKRKR